MADIHIKKQVSGKWGRSHKNIYPGDSVTITDLKGRTLKGFVTIAEEGKHICDECMLQREADFCTAFPCIGKHFILKSIQQTQPKGKTVSNKIDQNVVALVRTDSRTVNVKFANSGDKLYTYVTTAGLNLQPDDTVVVPNVHGMSLATVVSVDSEACIPLDADTKYAWILAKVDLSYAKALTDENEKIENAIRTHYKEQAQRSFRTQVLSGLSPDALSLLPASVTNGVEQPKVGQ